MPAATTRADLLAVTRTEYCKLDALLDKVPPDRATALREDGSSIRDVVAHRAHWIDLFLGWHADGQAGREVRFPAPGYNWGDLKAYNAMLRQRHAGLAWPEARDRLSRAHARLERFIETADEAALYGGPMQGARNDWTTGRWAEAAGPSHYRSAAKWIRAALRADDASGR